MKIDDFKDAYDSTIYDDVMKKLREYLTCLKLANDYNIELYNTKYKDDPDFCLWEDKSVFTHIIKKPSCVICKHCTDVWIDTLTTEIYNCACRIGCDVKQCKTCSRFEEEREEY